MKLRALGNLSGAVGDQESGAEFEVEDDVGQVLVDRGIAKRVSEKPATREQPDKTEKE